MDFSGKTFLFFARGYNDLDHNAPIMNFFLGCGACVELINIDKHVFDHDYRIAILKRNERFKLRNANNWYFTMESPSKKSIVAVLTKVFQKIFLSKADSWTWNLLMLIWTSLRRNKEVLTIVERCDCIFFEWGSPFQRGIVPAVVHRYAKASELPTVALPHGCNIFTRGGANQIVRRRVRRVGRRAQNNPFNFYNYYCVQNPSRQKQLESSYGAPKNIVSIGSMRFSPEWRSIMREHLNQKLSVHSNGLKVTLMGFQKGYGVDNLEMTELIHDLMKTHGVSLVIKTSTREGKALDFTGAAQVVGNEHHSMNLIAESDVVISYGSSIAIEVVLQHKLLLIPTFTGVGKCLFEEYGIGLVANTPTDLKRELQHLARSSDYRRQAVENQAEKLHLIEHEFIRGGAAQPPEESLSILMRKLGVNGEVRPV